jgi:hypothetical protein
MEISLKIAPCERSAQVSPSQERQLSNMTQCTMEHFYLSTSWIQDQSFGFGSEVPGAFPSCHTNVRESHMLKDIPLQSKFAESVQPTMR